MASFTERIHQNFVYPRRVRVLSRHLAGFLPRNGRVLDVGCGDGEISQAILKERPDLQIEGIEVLLRGKPHIRVTQFDGLHIPFADNSFDTVMFVDVLHHTGDPAQLLREAARVAAQRVVIKDHTMDGFLAFETLRFLDRVGNARHGVALPFNYWKESQWRSELRLAALPVTAWKSSLQLYPWPASMLFDRSLHFVAELEPERPAAA